VRSDVEAVMAGAPAAAPAADEPVPVDRPAPQEAVEATTPAAEPATARVGEAVAAPPPDVRPLSRLQQTVARRMTESRATVPDFELRVDVDMGACVELREELRTLGIDPLPSINDIIVKAAAVALREFPRVNGAYRDAGVEYHHRINIGIAVAAEDTLVVPVVDDADSRSLRDIARTSHELASKVRAGSVAPQDVSGGTFTVSNLGMFGIDSFSAVINMPQAAILAVGAIRRKPVAGPGDEVLVRPVATLTLACDHRVLYGADGARFLARVRELLERPLSLLL
jgi:pyruvate dehydrogenase E2 component (dihydrolipoamide acetyltransferase)